MTKIFWLAGEKSGDLHASFVMKKLNQMKMIEHYGVGGALMQAQGLETLFDFQSFNVMGFVEVIKHLAFFMKVEKAIELILKTRRPDLVVLVDYPGLNLRIAKIAKSMGIKVLYYICPQFWAWKQKRVYKIKKYTDFVCCINPFEEALLKQYGVANSYVGHPVAEEIRESLDKAMFAEKFSLNQKKEWVGLFPGSRKAEIERHLAIFIQVAKADKNREYLLSVADSHLSDLMIKEALPTNIKLIAKFNYDIMKHSDFVVAKSGTTTLETSLFATPFVIVYRANRFTVAIARKISHVKYIGLPNLIADRLIVKELIQEEMTAENILNEITRVLNDAKIKADFIRNLSEIKHILGDRSASENCANEISELLKNE